MTIEEDLKQYKSVARSKSRRKSVLLWFTSIVAIMFVIYGLTQSVESGRQRDLVLKVKEQSLQEAAELKRRLVECESKNK